MINERIHSDPKIMFGKPVVRGTRVTVEDILRRLAANQTAEQIVAEHPNLTLEDVRAAQSFAADFLAADDVRYG